jgi:tricorn protease-like protein
MNVRNVLGVIIGTILVTTLGTTLMQRTYAAIEDGAQLVFTDQNGRQKATTQTFNQVTTAAPMALLGNNLYIVWWTNESGNWEVLFRASNDSGQTIGDKLNLSNSTNADSQDAEIAASGNNVYVTWWERNATSEEPVIRISTDNGKTFVPILKLAANGTIGGG